MQNPHSSNLTFETPHGSVGSDQELPKFSNSNSKENLKSPRVANPDAWARLIGPHNIAPLKVENFETNALLDSGSMVSTISESWVKELGLHLFPLEPLLPIQQAGGTDLDYLGYSEVNLKSDFPKIDLNVPLLVVPTIDYHDMVPVTLGTKTLKYLIDQKLLEDKDLPSNWVTAKESVLTREKMLSSPDTPIGVARLSKSVHIPAFGSKDVQCLAKAKTHAMMVNVIIEGKEGSKIPDGIEVQNTYTDLQPGRSKAPVRVRNTTARDIEISKGTVVGNIFCTNKIPKILNQSLKSATIPNRVGKVKTDFEQTDSKVLEKDPEIKTKEDYSWLFEKLDLSGMESWAESTQAKARDLIISYVDIFSKHDLDLGQTNLTKHHIKLADYTPFKESYRRIPPHLYEEVKAHLKEMIDLGAIRKSQSPWSSSIVLVRKKDGGLRFCIDLRKLNKRTIKDNYSLPKIEHQLEHLLGAEWFTTLDLKSGYWQVEMTEESKPLTAFTVGPLGFYECDKMPFGASNAPATFQRLMENCLGDLNLSWCVVYLDDIIVFGKSPDELLDRLKGVFEKLRQANLKLKPSKCTFFKQEISYLGHRVSKNGIATDPKKVEVVNNWPVPKTIKELRSFLGFVGYYRKFIMNFSKIAQPLNAQLEDIDNHKKGNTKPLVWELEHQLAFESLKEACCEAPILAYADFRKPFILHTDSSLDGLGAVLYQEDQDGQLRVIAYASRSLSKSERNYPVHKLEFLALKWAVTDKFKEYLYGATFEVYTDNNPLTYVMTSAKLDACSHRWVAALASYDFSLYYKQGKQNVDADSLSRIKWPEVLKISDDESISYVDPVVVKAALVGVSIPYGFMEIVAKSMNVVPPDSQSCFESEMTQENWIYEQGKDPVIDYIVQLLKQGNLLKVKPCQLEMENPGIRPYLRHLKQLHLEDGLLYRKQFSAEQGKKRHQMQIVLPPQLIPQALKGCHDEVGHLGRDKTMELLRERFYWPFLHQDVVNHIAHCGPCLRRKTLPKKEPLHPISVSKPMELVHMDYLAIEPSTGNIENVLVITDHFTRYAQAYPTSNQTALTTAKVLWNQFVSHYGFPDKIISDQGRNFESQLIKDLCKIGNVDKIRTTPYHPMTNGQCERFNKTLLDMLGTLPLDKKVDWKSHLNAMTFAYNSTKNATTGCSPYYLMFGRHPRLPIDVAFGLHRKGDQVDFSRSKYINRLKKRLAFAFEKALQSEAKEQSRHKKLFDLKTKELKLLPGDLVLVRIMAYKSKHKIQNRWEEDEYEVLSQPNPSIPVFKVKNITNNTVKTLHRNLLFPLVSKSQEDSTNTNIPSDSDSDEEEEWVAPFSEKDQISSTKPSLVESNETAGQNGLDSRSTKVKEPSSENPPTPQHTIEPESTSEDSTNLFELNIKSSDSISDDTQTQRANIVDTPNTITIDDSSNGTITIEDNSNQNHESDLEIISKESGNITDSSVTEILNNVESRQESLNSQEASAPPIPLEPEIVVQQESLSESEDDDFQIPFFPRRSTRSTRGAPQSRYGNVVSHSVGPKYPDFEFCGI